MTIIFIYDNDKDREFLNQIDLGVPFFVRYISFNTTKGRKEAYKIKSYYSAKLNPFAVILDDSGNTVKAFYSEAEYVLGSLINFIMNNYKVNVDIINKSNNPLPKYETKGSAGMDIRADLSRVTPDNGIKVFGDAEVIWSGEGHSIPMVRLAPMSRALIPTGLSVAIPGGYQISLRPRSGISIKQGITLINAVGLIDSDYRNEIMVPVINLSTEDVFIEDGERICQALLEPVHIIEWNEVRNLDSTDRLGGFGSTGVK